jgi:hypothetical protein
MLAKQSSMNSSRGKNLIEHHFDDPARQAEFDALTNNEDRLDYIELIRGIEQVKEAGTISLDELKAFLSAE